MFLYFYFYIFPFSLFFHYRFERWQSARHRVEQDIGEALRATARMADGHARRAAPSGVGMAW
ncbi:biotin--[acetyl-CoA-carboxylase] ligase (plasmid) [Acetobacter orientalis]|uniref:Biotin--[acetyl-CoA-carboxylase] ligase n=1 Tax=Acetobacter orientalis TaxID=146474 RepID=A0A2Z5ZM98_9PROT|nr:biotin--[acetyl-CoA-carboxylase] ligase [Acetobacter orientalis]